MHKISKDTIKRFLEKTTITDGCWIWNGAKNNGYGVISVDGKRRLAHRLALQIACQEIDIIGMDKPPAGRLAYNCVLHSCDTPSCVNPMHLRIGTSGDNSLDMVLRNRHGGNKPSRITKDQYDELRKANGDNDAVYALAARFGISPGHAYNVAKNGLVTFEKSLAASAYPTSASYDINNPYVDLVRNMDAFKLDDQSYHSPPLQPC